MVSTPFYHNYTLVVGVVIANNYPLLSINKCAYDSGNLLPRKECPFPGFFAESIATQLGNSKVDYVVKLIPNELRSLKKKYELMSNGTVDLFASNHWFMTQSRRDMGFQFSIPTETRAVYSALVKRSNGVDLIESIEAYTTQVFQPSVLIAIGLLYFMLWMYELLPGRYKLRLLPTMLCVCAALALGFYGNRLLVNILRKTENAPFTDFDSMLESLRYGKTKMTRTANTGWYAPFVAEGGNGFSRKFVGAIKDNQPIIGDRKVICVV